MSRHPTGSTPSPIADLASAPWPDLPLEAWSETRATLHLWTQIVGKVRLTQSPWINHGWHATLYVTPRGLTTGSIPHGTRSFSLHFDFLDHRLVLDASDGATGGFALEPMTVASFYRSLMNELDRLALPVAIHPWPNEIDDPIRFDQDEVHRSYDGEYAGRFWRVLVGVDRVMHRFRAGFLGKCSPVHLFWGSLDLAVTRFSGRKAPTHPRGIPHLPDWITREAYSHQVSSCGFWAGSPPVDYPAFYSYCYPDAPGFAQYPVQPAEAFYHRELGEFILPYDAVRQSATPEDTLLQFLQTTYEAAATSAGWDRAALEAKPDRIQKGGTPS